MRKVLVLACLVGVLACSIPAMAKDGNNFADVAGDAFTFRNTYGMLRLNKKITLEKTFFGIDELKVGAFALGEISEPKGDQRDYFIGPEVEVTW